MSTDTIRIETRYIARASPSQPAFVLQATCLAGSYMLWIGTAEDGGRGDDESAQRLAAQGSVARDWACAMPPIQGRPALGTPLFRTSGSDAALGMAQRLARRFGKQMFVSVDVAGGFMAGDQGLLGAERALVSTLKELEGEGAGGAGAVAGGAGAGIPIV